MVVLRIGSSFGALRGAAIRTTQVQAQAQVPLIRTHHQRQQRRAFAATTRAPAPQGYGDADGKPSGGGKNPQKRPAATAAQESLEHPGPEPPDVGKGTGAGPTKAAFSQTLKEVESKGASTPEEASAQSGGSRSKEAMETGHSPTGGDLPNANTNTTTGGTPTDAASTATAASQNGGEALKGPQGEGKPRPKIHNQSVPGVREGLTEEQKREVERHNEEFEKRHDRGKEAPDDKVDKKFWKGQ